MDRVVFDADVLSRRLPHRIHHRVERVDIELSAGTFDDLCRVHLCDWLESVVRIDNSSEGVINLAFGTRHLGFEVTAPHLEQSFMGGPAV